MLSVALPLTRSAALLFAAACCTAAADEPVLLEPVQVTAARVPQGASAVPQPLTVLTAEQLAAQTPQVLPERLRGATGAYVQQTGAGQGTVILRGLKGAEVLHLVDGFRLNNAFFRTAPSQYIALVDPYNVAQLEVLRGPYGTLYGSDAMGGVVQVITPEARFQGAELQTRNQLALSYSTADAGFSKRLSHAVGTEQWSVSGGTTVLDYGDRRVAGPAQSADGRGGVFLSDTAGPSSYSGRGYDIKTLWKPSADQQWMFAAQYFELPNLPRYNEVVPGFGAAPAVAVSRYDNNRAFYHLRYRHQQALAFVDSLELHLGRQLINDDRLDVSLDLRTRSTEGNRSTLDGVTAQASSRIGEAHRLSYGLEFYRDRVRSNKQVQVDGGALIFSSPTSPNSVKARFPDNAHSSSFGVYLRDAWQPTARSSVDAGLRYSVSKTTLAVADRVSGGVVASDDLSGAFGGLYRLTPTLSATANFGRAFRAPNINDLAQTGRRSGSPPRITTRNTELRPETVTSGDLGLKWFAKGLQAEVSLFYADYRGRITTLPTGRSIAPGTEGCPSGTTACVEVQNLNIAKARYSGVESGLRYAHSSVLRARATLNYVYAEQDIVGVTSPGNRTPPLNGELAIEYQALPSVLIEPSVYFNGAQHRLDATDLADNRINPNGTGGFAVLNLRGVWQPNPTWRVQLTGENLLDQHYREHGSGIDGKGRGATLSIAADWR